MDVDDLPDPWHRFADDHRLRFAPSDDGRWGGLRAALTGEIENVPVKIELFIGPGANDAAFARFCGAAPDPIAVRVRVRRRSWVRALAASVARRSVRLEHADVDASFVIASADVLRARQLVDSRLAAALLALPPRVDVDLRYANGDTHADWRFGGTRAELDAIRDVVVAASRSGPSRAPYR